MRRHLPRLERLGVDGIARQPLTSRPPRARDGACCRSRRTSPRSRRARRRGQRKIAVAASTRCGSRSLVRDEKRRPGPAATRRRRRETGAPVDAVTRISQNRRCRCERGPALSLVTWKKYETIVSRGSRTRNTRCRSPMYPRKWLIASAARALGRESCVNRTDRSPRSAPRLEPLADDRVRVRRVGSLRRRPGERAATCAGLRKRDDERLDLARRPCRCRHASGSGEDVTRSCALPRGPPRAISSPSPL